MVAIILVNTALCWLSCRVGSPLMREIRIIAFNVKNHGLRALAPKRRTKATHRDAMIWKQLGDQVEPRNIMIVEPRSGSADRGIRATRIAPDAFKLRPGVLVDLPTRNALTL
jgi:hypothetical protein